MQKRYINCHVAIKKKKKKKKKQRIQDAHELHHWDMQQTNALHQDFSSMTNLTLLKLSNELDSNCPTTSGDKF